MHQTDNRVPPHRLALAQTLPGRWSLNLHVHCRRWLWRQARHAGRHAKRCFDVAPSALLLALSSPLLLLVAPLQLLAYHIAVARGCEVDNPSNLAKTVTVE